jgi:hypothetical protein
MDGKLDSALLSLRKAAEILGRLDRQFHGVLKFQGGLAAIDNMMSDLHHHRREPADALALAEKARTVLERLVSEHPEDLNSRIELARSYNSIGRGLQHSGEPAEALHSFRRAVDLYESISTLDPRSRYNLACNVSLCIPLIGAKRGTEGTLDPDELNKTDQVHRRLYRDRAMEVLRRAARDGFLDPEILQSDTDLNPIRDRPDFADLIKDVTKKSGPDQQ